MPTNEPDAISALIGRVTIYASSALTSALEHAHRAAAYNIAGKDFLRDNELEGMKAAMEKAAMHCGYTLVPNDTDGDDQ